MSAKFFTPEKISEIETLIKSVAKSYALILISVEIMSMRGGLGIEIEGDVKMPDEKFGRWNLRFEIKRASRAAGSDLRIKHVEFLLPEWSIAEPKFLRAAGGKDVYSLSDSIQARRDKAVRHQMLLAAMASCEHTLACTIRSWLTGIENRLDSN